MMKKKMFSNRITSAVVILTLAVCIGCGIFGMAKAIDLLSVKAGDEASAASGDVSPTETTPDAVPEEAVDEEIADEIADEIVGQLYTYDVPPAKAVPFTMTHTVTTDSGKVKTTHTPSGVTAQQGKIYNLYNAGGDYTTTGTYAWHNQLNFDTAQASFSGVLENGEAVGIEIPQDYLADEDFYGSFTVTLSDGSTLDWPCAKNQHNPPHYFDFDFVNVIGAQLPEGVTATEYAVNIPYNTGGLKAVNLTRNTLATTVRMRSADEGNAWDNLYPASAVDASAAAAASWKDTNLGVETLLFASDSASSLSAYVSRGGRFYIEETNDERRIRSLHVSNAGSGQDVTNDCITMVNGKYLITMPDYPVDITVESEALPVHKLTIEASTPDYSMNGIQQVDSRQAGTVYSDGATRLRFSNDRCTSVRANGNENSRRSNYSKITVNDFYRVGDFSWWTSVLAYAHEGKWNLAEGTGSQYVKITNVRFYRVENATEEAVSPSSVGFSEGVQNGRPYIRFVPQDYDMKVTFDVTERPEGYAGWHKIYLHETRPTTEDTVWCNYFYQKGSDPVIIPGTAKSGSSSSNSNYVYDNANPMNFPGTENTFTVGWFKTDSLYTYGLYHVNAYVPHSTMVRSWHVYKANSDGTSTGEEVTLGYNGHTLSFAGLSEGDYLIARDTNDKKKNKAIFEGDYFWMPDCDIVIDVAFGKTVSPCNIVQQIADENGVYQPIAEDIDVTFTGTPRDADTHAFYEGDSVTVKKANNYIGYYKGTKDVSFTVNPPVGYVVSAVEYYIDYKPNTKYTNLVRDGNTFTIPNKNLRTEDNSGNPKYTDGVGFGVTISYSKFVPVTVGQQVDGTPMPGSDAAVGTVKVTSQNGGTFMDSSLEGTPASSFSSVLTKSQSSVSDSMMSSLGNKLSVQVLVSDNSRVIGGVEIIRTRGGVDEILDIEPTKYVQNEAVYDLPEGLGLEDSLTVNVTYKTAQRLTVDIVVKTPTNTSTFSANTTTATATVTAVDSTSGDAFEKFPVEAGIACDSFTVSGSTPAKYLTRGNLKIRLNIGSLPEGYVVANVMAVPMKDNGDYNSNASTNAINPTDSGNIGDFQNLRSYAVCTMTVPEGQNYYIRVFLARTSSVTIRLKARGSSVDALFAENTLAHTYMIFDHSNTGFGVNFYPVIITNGGNRYNTDSYYVDNNPATRTVDVVGQTRLHAAVTMPEGYIIACIVATRTSSSGGDAENLALDNGTNYYKKDNDIDVMQQNFFLNRYVEGGYHYDITVNIEEAALVQLKALHINEQGVAVPNTLSNSQVTLVNSRGGADADAPYNAADYQSTGSFVQTKAGTTRPATFVSSLLTYRTEPEKERYVLRQSDFVLTARPVDGEEVASVVCYDADVPDTKVECEYIGDSGSGQPMYHVPMKSFMGGKLVIEAVFSAERTFGRLRIINRDIYGNEISNPGVISLTLQNNIFSRPGRVDGDDTWFAQTNMTGSDETYEITMGSTVKLETYGGGFYSLSHMTLDGAKTDYAKDNHYRISITLRENETVTVVNYFAKTAVVRESAYYSDLDGYVSSPVIRFSGTSGYTALTSYGYFMQDGEQVFYTVNETNGKALIGSFAAGEQSEFHLIVREQAGYILDHIELEGPSGQYEFTRAQLTNAACPERGQNNIYVSWDDITHGDMTAEELSAFKQSFKQLVPGKNYYITAYYTTRVIHVSAREITYEEFQRIEEEEEGGFSQYVRTHTVGIYHDPSRVADVGAWSIDGKNDIYYISNHENGNMGVRPGSFPTVNVHSQFRRVSSSETLYYRIGAVFYGTLNMQTPRALPTLPPVPFEVGASFNSEQVNEEMYLTVIYIVYSEKNITPPTVHNYDDSGTEWKNTGLTINFYMHDDATGEDNIITDPAVLAELGAKLTVSQHCVGYHYESSDESAKHSNEEHHANYKPASDSTDPEDVPIVYEHRDYPALSRLVADENGANWETVIPALIEDGEHSTAGHTETADPVSIDTGHVKYAVLSNNIDKVNVSLELTPPENYVLDRLEINDGDGKIKTQESCGYGYEVKGSVDDKVLTYYFRRPTIEVFTNNAPEMGSEFLKGTVKVVSGEENSSVMSDEVIVAESSDYSRSTQYDAGKVLKLIAVPEPGYYVAEVRCGSPLKNSGDIPLVSDDQIAAYGEGGAKLITLGSFDEKLLRVVVNFRRITGETYVPLTVAQFIIDSDGTVTPIETGTVIIVGAHDDASVDKPLVSGGQASSTIRLENASMLNADVYIGTRLSFKPTAPTGYDLATGSDFFDEGVTGAPVIPIDAFYTEGDTTVNITYTKDGVSYSLDSESGGESVVKENRSLTVNIYYAPPIFDVKYVDPLLGNETHTESVAYGENTVISTPEELGWSHDGYDFDGWEPDPGTTEYLKNPGSTITVTSDVTFTAKWKANTFTVTYVDPTCGNENATETIAYNEKTAVKSPDNLGWTHTGYTFNGWTPTPATLEYLKDPGSEITVTSDVTFTARWSADTYKVVYVYDGSVPEDAEALPTDSHDYHYGHDVTAAAKPSVPDGYTFTGWLLGEEETTGFTIGADTPVTGAVSPYTITLTGRWVREGEVSILYTSGVPESEIDNDSLRITKTDSCIVGRNYTVKPNAGWTDYQRGGYTFKGWKVRESASPSPAVTPGARRTASGGVEPLRRSVTGFFPEGGVIEGITENVTFEAVWEANPTPDPGSTYKVTYDGNGATGGSAPVDSTEYPDGGIVTVHDRNDLVKAGSTFVGWNTKADGSGTSYAPGKTFKINGSDVTLYAIWKADGETGGGSPGTGESMMMILLAAMAMAASAAAAGGVYARYRRKRAQA